MLSNFLNIQKDEKIKILQKKKILQNEIKLQNETKLKKVINIQNLINSTNVFDPTKVFNPTKENPTQNKLKLLSNELDKLNNPNIIINIVYQYKYIGNVNVTGLGDFIRGCFFLLQFSDDYNINVDFSIFNHPIKNYLNYFLLKNDISEDDSKNVDFFKKDNYSYFTNENIINYKYTNINTSLVRFINNLPNYDNTVFLYLTNHPDENKITQTHKNKICDIFKPTNELDTIINTTLLNIKLTKKCFKIIHIRMEYDFFYDNNKTIFKKHINFLIKKINIIKQNTRDDILLISNTNNMKSIILKYIPSLKCIFYDITHICDKLLHNDINIINTLKDFYIMSYANYIYSFSVYEHGSGFSKWCSVAYNIPYICYRIN